MSESYSRIPESLQALEDDRFREAHQRLAGASLDEVRRVMPAVQRHSFEQAGFVDLRPEEECDAKRAVVVPFPFTNGWEASMALRLRLLQASMPQPTRVIGFPHNTLADRQVYSLSRQELVAVSSGDFEPLARQQLTALAALGIESFGLWGYSAGAAIGAATLRLAAAREQFSLHPSGLAEEPNGLDRTQSALRKAFTAPGLTRLNAAVAASGMPALVAVQAADGWRSRPRQLWQYVHFMANATLASNRAIRLAFAHDGFGADVLDALSVNPELRLLIARASDSLVTPADSPSRIRLQKFAADTSTDRLQFAELTDYGHEAGDNIALHALLARAALTNTARSVGAA